MNTVTFFFVNVISGRPGRLFGCILYPLTPFRERSLRTNSSGFVSFARIALIVRETLSSFGTGARPSRIYRPILKLYPNSA